MKKVLILLLAIGAMLMMASPVHLLGTPEFPRVELARDVMLIVDSETVEMPNANNDRMVSRIQLWNPTESSIWITATFTWVYPDGEEVVPYVTYVDPKVAWLLHAQAPKAGATDYIVDIRDATEEEITARKQYIWEMSL